MEPTAIPVSVWQHEVSPELAADPALRAMIVHDLREHYRQQYPAVLAQALADRGVTVDLFAFSNDPRASDWPGARFGDAPGAVVVPYAPDRMMPSRIYRVVARVRLAGSGPVVYP